MHGDDGGPDGRIRTTPTHDFVTQFTLSYLTYVMQSDIMVSEIKETEKEMYEIRKTTNGEYNRGICGSPNNARYKGNATVWAVTVTEGLEIAYKRKADAVALTDWAKVEYPEGSERDLEALFLHSETGHLYFCDHDWKGEA